MKHLKNKTMQTNYLIGGIICGYFIKPYIDILIKIIKNSLKNKTMKQTAIEFLISKIESNSNPSLTQKELKESIEQAKEMEKQQIVDAYNDGEFTKGYGDDAEQYYSETYKK